MVRITVEGPGHEKVGKQLKEFFIVGQRKTVKHFVIAPTDVELLDVSMCDIAIIEIKEKQEVKK